MKLRAVTIYGLSVLLERSRETLSQGVSTALETNGLSEITLTATVSKGTYIRSLARDIARALNTVGHVTMLRRTKAGPFSLKRAISLDKLNEIGKGADITDYLLPLEAGLDDIPAFDLTPDQAKLLRQGMTLDEREMIGNPALNGLFLAKENHGSPVALAELVDGTVKGSGGSLCDLMSKGKLHDDSGEKKRNGSEIRPDKGQTGSPEVRLPCSRSARESDRAFQRHSQVTIGFGL